MNPIEDMINIRASGWVHSSSSPRVPQLRTRAQGNPDGNYPGGTRLFVGAEYLLFLGSNLEASRAYSPETQAQAVGRVQESLG